MNDLINWIEKLSREETLIAAQNLTLQITQNASRNEREEELPKPFIDKPSENVQEIEQLARLILLTGAVSSESLDAVRSTTQEVCETQASLEGTEIIVLATLGLFALSLLAPKDESTRDYLIEIEEENLRTTFIIESSFSYEVSPHLGQVLKTYFGSSEASKDS